MAYARKFIQLTWGGAYFDEDIWVNGLHIIDATELNTPGIEFIFGENLLTEVTARLTEMHSHVDGNSSFAKLDWVKLAVVGTDGKYTRDPLIRDVASVAGGRARDMYPQLATAVSLRTEKKRGPSAYGRFYAPVALGATENGRSSLAERTLFLDNVQNKLTEMNVYIKSLAGDPEVGFGNVSKVGAGSQELITGVFVGDLTDTQRRRRNKLRENYYGLAI